ncbi:MAG: Calx-beta domain-containing protein, partial [Candidatus Poribacteria bacterium]
MSELDARSSSATLTATLSNTSDQSVSVVYITADGTALIAGDDYTAASDTLTLAPGELTSAPFEVLARGDFKDEDDETFTVVLSDPVNATLDGGTGLGNASGVNSTATVTIVDNDDTPTVSIASPATQDEGTATIKFPVTLSAVSGRVVTVDYTTADGTAEDENGDGDYDSASGTFTFTEGLTGPFTILVTVNADAKDEDFETFSVTLSNPSNATIDTATGAYTISDNDEPPSMTINSPTVLEDAAEGVATFTATLDAASGRDITVDYATSDGSATAPEDYSAVSGTLTFEAGETVQSFDVPVTVDALDEDDESFVVALTGAINVTVLSGQSSAVITDDDASPTLSVDSPTVDEDVAQPAVVTVSLSAVSGRAVTVDYATSDGSAIAPQDYTATAGTLRFEAGETSKPIEVAITDDGTAEAIETFTLNLSAASNASVAVGQATVTVGDSDGKPTILAEDVTTSEGGSEAPAAALFKVSLSGASGETITVDFMTEDLTAKAPEDYTSTAGTLTFAPGDTETTFSVPVAVDALDEDDERFVVEFTNPLNATLATPQVTATIADDDPLPGVSVDSPRVTEDTAVFAMVTMTLSTASGRDVTVDYTTTDATAIAPDDYTATAGTRTFVAGQTTQTFDVIILADAIDEDDETVTVTLSSPVNVQLPATTASVTITDDDDAPNLSIGGITVTEGSSLAAVSPTTASFVVTLDAASGKNVTVTYATADGTATEADGDYTAAADTLTLAPGELTSSVDVSVAADYDDEPDETFVLSISAVTNATASVLSATATIADDDEPPLTVTAPTTASEGQDVTYSAEIVLPISNVTSANLLYAPGGSGLFTPVVFVNTAGNTWMATVPGPDVSVRGLVWYVEVTDDLDGGRAFSDKSFRAPGYVAVNGSADLPVSTMVTTNIWNGVGPAVSPDNPAMSTTFDTADGGFITEWFAWRWNAAAQQWEAAESLGDSTPVASDGFETGKGWFVAVIGDGTSETRSVMGRSVDPTARQALPILAGWNLLANPFNFPVAWSDATIRASVLNQELPPTDHLLLNNAAVDNRLIYLDTPSQDYVTRASNETTSYTIPPGQAFWFLSNQSGELLIPAIEFLPSPNVGIAPAELKAKGDWRIFVSATSEFGSDRVQAIAAHDAKSAQEGTLGHVKAPGFPGSQAPRVTLINLEVEDHMSRLNRDVQTIGDEMVWLLDVSNGDGAVISWQTVDVPADYDLRLVDLTSERVIDLRQGARIRLEGSAYNSRQYALKAVK